MSHLAANLYELDVVDETAFQDCISTIKDEHQSANVSSDDDLRARWDKLKEKKGLQ